MKWEQTNNGMERDCRPPNKQSKKHRPHGRAFGFVACLLAAALLFGAFYAVEYGMPLEEKTVAAAADTAASALLLNETDTKSAADATAITATETEGTSGFETDTASAGDGTVVGTTYTSDNMQITVTEHSSGSGNAAITWYVADIQITDLSLLSTCFANDTYGNGITAYVLDMAVENSAVLAVNGDYYSEQKNNIVIRNGELYQESDTTMDLCVLYKDGTMATYGAGEITASEAIANGAWQAWNFGPELLADDGSALISFNTSDRITSANPRTAIGYYEPGHYCLVVVDGRSAGYSCGMTLSELSQVFEDMGCVQAYNLDGGKSSVMVFNGTVVNQPADGGREVSDAILLG